MSHDVGRQPILLVLLLDCLPGPDEDENQKEDEEDVNVVNVGSVSRRARLRFARRGANMRPQQLRG